MPLSVAERAQLRKALERENNKLLRQKENLKATETMIKMLEEQINKG